jgi:hypothetical protein
MEPSLSVPQGPDGRVDAGSGARRLWLAPVRYLAQLTTPKVVLWCYFIWWLYTALVYFDPSPRLWLSSAGISVIIGTGLYLSTAHGGRVKTTLDRWQVFRLYLMPLCVSSFAALIKDRGFVLVFHPTLGANLKGFALCGLLCSLTLLAKRSALGSSAEGRW